MESNRRSPSPDLPEAVNHADLFTYEYYDPPPASPHTSYAARSPPLPEYQSHPTSPDLSSSHPSTVPAHSPTRDDDPLKRRPLSPAATQYSEVTSPAPQLVHQQNHQEKEYVPPYVKHEAPVDATRARLPEPRDPHPAATRKPWYRRWWVLLLLALLVIAIVLGVTLGVVLSRKEDAASDPGRAAGAAGEEGDPEISVGGYLNPAYYSREGAWNGTGIAIAAANPGVDKSIYAFYQDARGDLQYTLMKDDDTWATVGPVNDGSHRAMNGTPLSAVNHLLANVLVWHLFYIDEDHIVRERILTNSTVGQYTPTWIDGPLNDKNLKASKADTIGMQACYWGNYYGLWSHDETAPSAGIHIWYASSATVFQQYSWTNGTNAWEFDESWSDLDGHAGVGCQTWASGMTEYIWFVNTDQEIAMYWKDSNQSAPSTSDHPINSWEEVPIGITDVHPSSSLGYTNYLIYQASDASVRGVNVTWRAENTTIATKNNAPDQWIIEDLQGDSVKAIRGTHLSITALKTNSGGARLTAFFQTNGTDVSMFTRDDGGGLWQEALKPVGV